MDEPHPVTGEKHIKKTALKFERGRLAGAGPDARKAAAYLAAAESTLRRMVPRGDLPHVHRGALGLLLGVPSVSKAIMPGIR